MKDVFAQIAACHGRAELLQTLLMPWQAVSSPSGMWGTVQSFLRTDCNLQGGLRVTKEDVNLPRRDDP